MFAWHPWVVFFRFLDNDTDGWLSPSWDLVGLSCFVDKFEDFSVSGKFEGGSRFQEELAEKAWKASLMPRVRFSERERERERVLESVDVLAL